MQGIVRTEGLNVHNRLGSHGKITDQLKLGDRVEILDHGHIAQYEWLKIQHARGAGWVYAPDIRMLPPDVPTEPPRHPDYAPLPDFFPPLRPRMWPWLAILAVIALMVAGKCTLGG